MDGNRSAQILEMIYNGKQLNADNDLLTNGLQFRFSDAVYERLKVQWPMVEEQKEQEERVAPCICMDGVLPSQLVKRLQWVLREGAPFWREHDYGDSCAYFSYWHDLNNPDGTLMEQVAQLVLHALTPKFPALASCTKIEWWAHSRDHERGHQLHWDSDSEGYPTGKREMSFSLSFFFSYLTLSQC